MPLNFRYESERKSNTKNLCELNTVDDFRNYYDANVYQKESKTRILRKREKNVVFNKLHYSYF